MKYYIPEIEEFRIGFEFEFKNDMQDNTWEKAICDSDLMSIVCSGFEHDSNIEEVVRVKYLDREDIESVNFTDYRHSTNDWYKMVVDFSIGNIPFKAIRLSHNYDDSIISIMGYEYVFEMENATEETQLFYGKIRNISEFKILLKQLNIL